MGAQGCLGFLPLYIYSLPLPFSFCAETASSGIPVREADSHITYSVLLPALSVLFLSLYRYLECPCSSQSQAHHLLCAWRIPFIFCLLKTLLLQFSLLSFISSIPFTLLKSNSKYSRQMPHRGLLRFFLGPRYIQSWDDTVFCISHPWCLDTLGFDMQQGVLQIIVLQFVMDFLTQLQWSQYPQ